MAAVGVDQKPIRSEETGKAVSIVKTSHGNISSASAAAEPGGELIDRDLSHQGDQVGGHVAGQHPACGHRDTLPPLGSRDGDRIT